MADSESPPWHKIHTPTTKGTTTFMPRQNKVKTKDMKESVAHMHTWEPKSRTIQGVRIYCSPACGRLCTRKEYEQALTLAKSMCKALGSDWTEGVHENLGWFSTAIHKTLPARITPFKYNGRIRDYSCDICVEGRQFLASGPTPKKALDAAIKHMTSERDLISRALTVLRGK